MLFSKSIVLLTALPAVAHAGFRGGRTAKRQLAKDKEQMAKQEDMVDPDSCVYNPLYVGVDAAATPVYSEDKVVLAIMDGVNGTEVDIAALGATMGPAYNGAVDCSFSYGSFRELMGCEVIEGAVFAADGDVDMYLIRCREFFSNSVDNSVFLSEEDAYSGGSCECKCGENGELFPQLMKNGECDCDCDGKPMCECPAPFIDTFVTEWNTLYTGETLDADITVFEVIEITILDPDDCGVQEETTFNGTAICPGNMTEAFASYFTDAPSAAPSASPSASPTAMPNTNRKPY
ncbi:MAG: hypothetical protein SGARI_004362 [Bacillariaceae sp.]